MWVLIALVASKCEFYVLQPYNVPLEIVFEWLQKAKDVGLDGVWVEMPWIDPELPELNETIDHCKKFVDGIKAIGLKMTPQLTGIPPYLKYPDHFLVGPEGHVNTEYYSFALNHVKIGTRTPMEMHRDYCLLFKKVFQSYFDDGSFREILTAGGPLGEFRYPGYQIVDGGWKFPGCGQFQSFDKYMSKDLKEAAEAAGHPEWGHSPTNGGGQNVRPGGAEFWKDGPNGWNSPYGKWYIKWYHDVLVKHVFDYCKVVKESFGPDIHVVGKFAGLHWWYRDPTHCVETTCGMSDFDNYDGYKDLLGAFKANNLSGLSYTALEQGTSWRLKMDNPALIDQILKDLKPLDMWLEGETAGETYDKWDYDRVVKLVPKGLKRVGFIGFGEGTFKPENWKVFTKFIADIHNA
jgi:beta-amylase